MISASSVYRERLTHQPKLPSRSYAQEVLQDQPAGYWRLGESSGTVAADSSGHGLDGTYFNAPLLGVAGALAGDTAVAFDAALSQHVNVPDHTRLDTGDTFTLEIFAKVTSFAVTRTLLEKGIASTGYLLDITTAGLIRLHGSGGVTVVSTATVTAGAYAHIAVTKSGATVKLYLNGVDVTGTVTNSTVVNNASDLNIGTYSGGNHFLGSLDEVAIYPTALSPARILAHYTSGIIGPIPRRGQGMTPISQVKLLRRELRTPTSAVPTVWYTLNEGGGSRTDLYGENHLFDTNTVGGAAGWLDGAAQFIAANSEYLSCTPDANLQVPSLGSFSFTCWVYLTSKAATQTIVSQYNDLATEKAWKLTYDQPTDRFLFETWSPDGTGTRAVSAATFGSPSTDAFYFITCRSSTVTGLTINVDAASDNNPAAPMFVLSSSAVPFRMGAQGDASGVAVAYLDGRVDEFGFYTTAISDADVALLRNDGKGVSPLTISGQSFSSSLAWDGEALGLELLIPVALDRKAEPESGRFPLSTLDFDVLDFGDQATVAVATNLVGAICEYYSSFYDLNFQAHRVQLFTGIVAEMMNESGRYRFKALSPMAAAQDKTIFNGASSRLTTAVNSTDTTLTLDDVSEFRAAGNAPPITRGLAKVENEIVIYRGKDATSLTLVIRTGATGFGVPPFAGPHGGAAASHAVGVEVREVVKLGNDLTAANANYANDEFHPIELLKVLFTTSGKGGVGEANIAVNTTQLDTVKAALGADVQMRFLITEGISAKRLIEEQLYVACAGYPIENSSGELGMKLLQSGSAATIVDTISDADIIEPPRWLRNAQRIVTTVVFHYDFMPITNEYQSTYTYRDETLVAEVGREITLEIFSQGIRALFVSGGSQEWFGETADFLLARAQAYVDRFGGISPVISVKALWTKHLLECGDDVECTFSDVPNLPVATRMLTSAKMEIIGTRLDFVNHVVELTMLGYPT